VSGATVEYKNKGIAHKVNARTGEAVPEQEAPADARGFRPFEEDGKYGIKNAAGAISVPPAYGKLYSLGNGLFAATREAVIYRDNWGMIDGNGREIIPFAYGGIGPSSYRVWTTGPLECKRYEGSGPTRHWLIGRDGRFVTPEDKPYHSSISFNAAGLAEVYRDGKHGVIDSTGKEVLPCVYQTVFDVLELRETRKRPDKKGAAGGAATAPPAPQDALFQVERGNLWGLYDGTGKELIPVQYGWIVDPEPGQAWIKVEDAERKKYGVVNIRTGQTIAPRYDAVSAHPGFFVASVRGNGKDDVKILLDREGKERERYDGTEWFEAAGVLAVRRHDKWALLDANGKRVSPFRYASVSKAAASFVWGETDAGRVLVDGSGREYRLRGKP
jgi:hypothetical protein